jgi:glycerol-3-phosphate acyltransferase PlsY
VTPEIMNASWWIPLAAYIIGSLPSGYLIARRAGQGDIRKTGSGNTGATNVARVAGNAAGALTFLLDAGKGALAVWLASWLTGGSAIWMVAAALGAMLGHIFPVWLGGKGGRGVSTGVGAFLMICWPAVVAAIVMWLIVLAVGRYVSLASILAAASLPLLTYMFYAPGHAPARAITIGTVAGAVMIILRHKPNIERLVAGTESRVSLRRERRKQNGARQ